MTLLHISSLSSVIPFYWIEFFFPINYAGQMLSEMRSNPAHYYTLPRSKGLLIVSIRSNKGKQFLKVMSK